MPPHREYRLGWDERARWAAVTTVAAVGDVHAGHAHAGREKGVTPGGIQVRNVAQPVIQHAYNLYCLGGEAAPSCDP